MWSVCSAKKLVYRYAMKKKKRPRKNGVENGNKNKSLLKGYEFKIS